MKNILQDMITVICSRTLVTILLLGVVSGVPLSILITALVAWFKDSGVSLTLITMLALARLPYSFKYCWAPIIDRFKVPVLFKLGRRRSWMIIALSLQTCAIFCASQLTPEKHFSILFAVACAIGFFSATYDIAYDAFRIESAEDNEQALAAATSVFGYRIGMLVVGAGALALSETYSWNQILFYTAIIFALVVLFLIFSVYERTEFTYKNSSQLSARAIFKEYLLTPLKDIIKRDHAMIIILIIISYKIGEAMIGSVSLPFYMELGFSKLQIAGYVKIYGFAATTLGSFLGGYIATRVGILNGLMIGGFLQIITNLFFLWLHVAGNNPNVLLVTICCDNIAGGMGSTVLVGYLSMLCNREYTASQYALLSSMATLVNNSFTGYTGTVVKWCGWDMFFLISCVLSLPSMFMILWLEKKRKTV